MGDLGCFSFFPSKNLGAGGDAGIITTNSEELYELCRILREHGQKPQYYHRIVGFNSRLDTIQAAMLLVKLPHLRKWSEKRIEHAQRYDREFAGVPNLTTPRVMPYSTFHIYNQYTLASPKRKATFEGLRAAGDIPTPGRLGDYELLKVIGRGGMGVVYQAHQVKSPAHVGQHHELQRVRSEVDRTRSVLKRACVLESRGLLRFRTSLHVRASHPAQLAS